MLYKMSVDIIVLAKVLAFELQKEIDLCWNEKAPQTDGSMDHKLWWAACHFHLVYWIWERPVKENTLYVIQEFCKLATVQ